jgi:hypothetical protein
MGYDLHITRADWWTGSAEYPISLDEWINYADASPQLLKHPVDAPLSLYEMTGPGAVGYWMQWRDGGILAPKAGAVASDLAVIADLLGARAVGDDEEEYHADGTFTHWTEPRPPLLRRPLNIDEVAGAWEVALEREIDADWQVRVGRLRRAQHAMASFKQIALRAVATADVDDADGLLYQYGPSGTANQQVYMMSLVRQLATDDSKLVQVECRVDFAMTDELAGLGTFHEWWFPDGSGAREAMRWIEAIEARDEWRALASMDALTMEISAESAC